MGNQSSVRASDGTSKIVFWDGSVHEIEEQQTVAELMLEHPQQVVVELHSAMNQRRPTPLPADKKLEMNKVYLMLPMKRGKPVCLTGEESRRILLVANSVLHSNYLVSSSRFLPLLTRLCQPGTIVEPGMAHLSQSGSQREKKEERCALSEVLPEILEGRPEYLNRQLSGKGWKPSLDTIKEKNIERKLAHWLFLKSS